MFDVGFSELVLTALVALIVLGPERLPKAARLAGMWIRRARMQWQAVKNELENELADEEMRRSILRARDDLREAQDSLRRQLADVEARMTRVPGTLEAAPVDAAIVDGTGPASRIVEPADTAALHAQFADVEAGMTAPSSIDGTTSHVHADAVDAPPNATDDAAIEPAATSATPPHEQR